MNLSGTYLTNAGHGLTAPAAPAGITRNLVAQHAHLLPQGPPQGRRRNTHADHDTGRSHGRGNVSGHGIDADQQTGLANHGDKLLPDINVKVTIGQPAMLFRSRANGLLNMIYRRPDGNIGWVDPQNLDRA